MRGCFPFSQIYAQALCEIVSDHSWRAGKRKEKRGKECQCREKRERVVRAGRDASRGTNVFVCVLEKESHKDDVSKCAPNNVYSMQHSDYKIT